MTAWRKPRYQDSPGKEYPISQYRPGPDHIGNSFSKTFYGLVTNKLITRPSTLAAKELINRILGIHQGECQQAGGHDPSSLLSIGETTSVVLCPVLGSL